MESYFEETTIDLGRVVTGKPVKMAFKAKDNIPGIKLLRASCGCTKPKFDPKTKTVAVKFTPKGVPNHLRRHPGFSTSKLGVTVVYTDNTRETLFFTAQTHVK